MKILLGFHPRASGVIFSFDEPYRPVYEGVGSKRGEEGRGPVEHLHKTRLTLRNFNLNGLIAYMYTMESNDSFVSREVSVIQVVVVERFVMCGKNVLVRWE